MSALLRNHRKISRTSSSFAEMKFYYALNQRRYLNLKSCSHQLTNLAAMSSANFHTALERKKHNESLFDTWNFYRNSSFSFSPARNIHIGRCLYETPSSKVEATVQTMKKQQKEKVDEMMKEVSNNAKAAAEADTIHDASTTSSSSSKVDKQKSAAATATATMSKEKTQAESSTANVPSTKAQDLKPVVVKKSLKTRIWEEIVHYYHGFRLLFIDINICRKLLWRVLNGKTLTRRENRLLVRTTSDLFRLIPFSVFIIVPFMELLLPLFIKFFPGMLPSTFQTSKEREDKLKQSLQVKLEMAKFLQKTLDEMAVQHKEHRSEEAKQFANFFQRIKDPNEYVTKDEIIKYASRFKDEITLDSLSREQLSALCRLLELNTMGTSNFLRFQLRMKLRSLAADDRVISREGVQSLDLYELQQACKARGMRAYGLTTERLHAQLQEWIDLSLNEKVPPTLLLLSRAIFISDHHTTTDKLKEIIRVLPDSVAAETKAAIGELEGKIDNKTKIEVIKEEERKIKEEREEEREEEKAKATEAAAAAAEVLLDKAPTIADDSTKTKSAMQIELPSRAADKPLKSTTSAAPAAAAAGAPTSSEQAEDNTLSSKDVELLSEALKTLSSATKKMIVEKEQIKEIKEELEDYKEDVEELHEVRNVVKEPVTESRAAKLLFKKVNKMIGQLDKVLDDLEKKQKQIQQVSSETVQQEKPTAAETALQHRQEDSVHVAELMEAIKKVKQTSTESRLKQIENVLSKLDADKDGVVTVNEVINVIEAIGRENVKLDEKQIEEVITLLDKEQMIQAEEKIEKALAKSIKESDMVKAKKEQQRRAELEELKDTAPELKDNAIDLEPPSKYDGNQQESSSTQQQASKNKTNPCNGTAKKSPKASVMQPTETPTTTPLPNASSSPIKPNSKDKML